MANPGNSFPGNHQITALAVRMQPQTKTPFSDPCVIARMQLQTTCRAYPDTLRHPFFLQTGIQHIERQAGTPPASPASSPGLKHPALQLRDSPSQRRHLVAQVDHLLGPAPHELVVAAPREQHPVASAPDPVLVVLLDVRLA